MIKISDKKIMLRTTKTFAAAAAVSAFICAGAGAACASWSNSDIAGAVTSSDNTKITDDFHRAVNKNWIADAKIKPGESSTSAFVERGDEVEEQIKSQLTDKNEKSHEAKLAQKFYGLVLDWDSRNKAGISPVMPLIEQIEAISNMEELTAYLTDRTKPHFGGRLLGVGTTKDSKDSSNMTTEVYRTGLSLGDAGEYNAPALSPTAERRKKANDVFHVKLLVKAGFDKDRAEKMNEAHFRVERAIAKNSMSVKEIHAPEARQKMYNVRTKSDLAAASPVFPLVAVIDALGYGHSREFVLEEPSWLTAMNEYYKPENLSDIKDYLIVTTLRGTVNLLDREARDFAVEQSNAAMGSEGSIPDDKLAYEMTDGWLSEAVGRMWAEKYATSKTKSDIEKMIGEVIAYYRDMLTRETWLSPETREKAINKLDHVTVRAAYPNKWEDFSELDFKGAGEGGSLVDAAWSISRFELSRDVKLVNTKTDREKWNLSPSIVNAFYSPLDNSINIPAGILGGVFYNPDAPREENLGAIGVIIGHELTHAFDTNGSQYDESGNMKNWWTEEDKEAFQKRADTVIQYYSTLDAVPGVKVDGELIHTEAIADLGGLGCMTAIGRKSSEKGEPFDFAKFYEAFARVWRNKSTKEMEEYKVKLDVHPLAFIRTNTSVQMQPEFYEAFGIKEGDGMYLAPEKRVSVW